MMRFATDENFNGHMLSGLRKRLPDLDIVRVQDTEMYGSPDPELLEWLAEQDRILLTHDIRTMPKFVYERVHAGLPVPGIVEIHRDMPVGEAIDELEVILGVGEREDFENQVMYVPM